MASRKVDFALAVRRAVTTLSDAAERIAELQAIYNDSAYLSGGVNEILDEHIEGHDITAQDLANFDVLAENLALFLNNGVPAQIDYASKINAFRLP